MQNQYYYDPNTQQGYEQAYYQTCNSGRSFSIAALVCTIISGILLSLSVAGSVYYACESRSNSEESIRLYDDRNREEEDKEKTRKELEEERKYREERSYELRYESNDIACKARISYTLTSFFSMAFLASAVWLIVSKKRD